MPLRLNPPLSVLAALAFPETLLFGPRRFPDGRVLTRKAADAIADMDERFLLLDNPLKVVDRLAWVAQDRRVPVGQVLQEIRGARTSVGVLLRSGAQELLEPGATA